MAYADEVLADAPAAYYRLGESSGTTLVDSSGNGRDGLYNGTPTLGVTGLLVGDADTAVNLDGAADYGEVAFGAWMDTSTFTVEAWVKPDTFSEVGIISRWYNGGARPFFLGIDSGGRARIVSSSSGAVCVGSTVLTAGSTYHLAATVSGGVARVYVNGVEDGVDASFTVATSASLPLTVGRYSSALSGFLFDGVIDEVAFYGTALSAARIADHYTAGSSAPAASGTLAATLPALTSNLAGTSAPPAVTGTLATTLPSLAVSMAGGSSAATITGDLAATLPTLTTNLTGTVPSVGTMAATLPALTASLTGLVAAPGVVAGALSAQLPTIEALFRGGSATPTTDTFNRRNGRTRSGTGWANLDEPVATVPATLTREPIRVMAQTLPTPTLEDGRPV